MKKRTLLTIIISLLVIALAVPVSLAWFTDTLTTEANMTSHVHKSYFESGDGTSARQFAGSGLESDSGWLDFTVPQLKSLLAILSTHLRKLKRESS